MLAIDALTSLSTGAREALLARGVNSMDALVSADLKDLGLTVGARARLRPLLEAVQSVALVPTAIAAEQRRAWHEAESAAALSHNAADGGSLCAATESLLVNDDATGLRERCSQAAAARRSARAVSPTCASGKASRCGAIRCRARLGRIAPLRVVLPDE